MPAAAAAASSGWSGRQPGRGDDEVDGVRPVGQAGDGIRAEPDVGAEDVEDARPLGMTEPSAGVGAVDDGDVGPALEQRVGGGEPAHPEAGDEHAQAGPVGVAVGERRRAGRWCRRSSGAHDPLGVEEPEPEGDEQPGDDPEPDHDRDLVPAEQLEVVLQRRHPEHPFAGRS